MRRARLISAATAAAFFSLSSMAAQIKLVKDINVRAAANPSSRPRSFLRVGDQVYFAAETKKFGVELYRSQGAKAAVSLVRDIWPGRASANVANLVKIGTTLYFTAEDGKAGRELWKTTGTAASTSRVVDLLPGSPSSDPQDLAVYAGRLFFTALDARGARALYRSDGTASGTQKLHDVRASVLHVAGKYLWFHDDSHGVWRSDGTAKGTQRVLKAPTVRAMFSATYALGGKYYFGGCESLVTAGLYVSDGTAQGTRRLLSLPFSQYCFLDAPKFFGVHKGLLWYSVTTVARGRELWKSDGTLAGSKLVADLVPGPRGSDPQKVFVLGGSVFVGDRSGALWKTDGSPAGTKAVLPPASILNWASVEVIAGRLWFNKRDSSGTELWTSDASPAGTRRVADIFKGAGSSDPSGFVPLKGGGVLFTAKDAVHGFEVWASDGTAVGTRLVADVNTGPVTLGSDAKLLGELAGKLFFSADDGSHGIELWISEGSAATTRMLADLVPGPASSTPRNALVSGQGFYFDAQVGAVRQLFVSDGTGAGIRQLTSFAKGVGASRVAFHGRVFFTANEAQGLALWSYDPRSRKSQRVFVFARASDWNLQLTSVGTQLFFVGYDAQHGFEVWKSDGSAVGTKLVEDLFGKQSRGRPGLLTAWHGRLYFAGPAAASSNGTSLWVSDGSAAGTQRLSSLQPTAILALDAQLFITTPLRLYHSDGSAAGTRMVSNGVYRPSHLTAFGQRVVFMALSGQSRELWLSDGTAVGTKVLRDSQNRRLGVLQNFSSVGTRRAYFSRSTPGRGQELFVTDGSAAGTRLVQDLNPGSLGAFAGYTRLTLAAGFVYLAADDGQSGRELYRLDPGATAKRIGSPCGPSQARLRATDPVLATLFQIAGTQAPAGAPGILLLGSGPSVQVLDCVSEIRQLALGLLVTGPKWSLQWPNPKDPKLLGVRLLAQTLYLNAKAPAGLEFSNAVDLRLGR